MYSGIENVWSVLTTTFKHKHLWLLYRPWPSQYHGNLRASNYPGQPVIVTGAGWVIAEWLPYCSMWSLTDLSYSGRTVHFEQSDEIYLCPPAIDYLEQSVIYESLIFLGF